MRYQGGKFRQGKKIAKVITELNTTTHTHTQYVEPFLGGCNIIPHLLNNNNTNNNFQTYRLSDSHECLMLMWHAVKEGWEPPQEVSREHYLMMKDSPPSPEKGFVGFACSFGGKWFGGYASGGERNFALEGYRAIMKKARSLQSSKVTLTRASYEEVMLTAKDSVIYCDPPYAGTTGYSTGNFDHTVFWLIAEEVTRSNNLVLVSEYTAPNNWESVYSNTRIATLDLDFPSKGRKENLYVLNDYLG